MSVLRQKVSREGYLHQKVSNFTQLTEVHVLTDCETFLYASYSNSFLISFFRSIPRCVQVAGALGS